MYYFTGSHVLPIRPLFVRSRLLYYYPRAQSAAGDADSWCTEHTDHGSLTALASAMFFDADGRPLDACPDPAAGLYIRGRDGQLRKCPLRPDLLFFQIGEAAMIASGGLLAATPHRVRAPRPAAAGVGRGTLALFMQPDGSEPLAPPPHLPPQVLAALAARLPAWKPAASSSSCQTFGEFTAATLDRYY